MAIRQKWTPQVTHFLFQQDDCITQFVLNLKKQNFKIRWSSVEKHLRQNNPQWDRTGKQCRERWIYHLKPRMSDNGKEKNIDIQLLLQLMRTHGKKWSVIARSFCGKTDIMVKNFFYASIKRGLNNINYYNSVLRVPKIYREIKLEIVDKLLCLMDEKKVQDLNLVDISVFQLSEELRQGLIRRSQDQVRSVKEVGQETKQYYEELNLKIQQFSRICKFKRCRNRKQKDQQKNFYGFLKKKTGYIEPQQEDKYLNEKNNIEVYSQSKNTSIQVVQNQQKQKQIASITKTNKKIQQQNSQLSLINQYLVQKPKKSVQMQMVAELQKTKQKLDLFQLLKNNQQEHIGLSNLLY